MCKWRGITIIYRWVKGVLYSCSFRKFRFIPVRHLGVMERETTILHSQDLQVALPSKERRSEDTREKEEQRGLPLIWAELFFKAYQQALAVVRATKHFTRRKQSSPCPLPIVLPSFCPQRNLTDRKHRTWHTEFNSKSHFTSRNVPSSSVHTCEMLFVQDRVIISKDVHYIAPMWEASKPFFCRNPSNK